LAWVVDFFVFYWFVLIFFVFSTYKRTLTVDHKNVILGLIYNR